MQDLAHTESSDLYDLLAQQTNRYMKMLSEGATKQEFDQCRETIISIQTEIQSRKKRKSPPGDPKSSTSYSGHLNRSGK